MEVAWHAEAGIVVISLWQDQTCRSTFRLPVEDAPALIGVLSSALGDVLSPARIDPQLTGSARRRGAGHLVAMLRRAVRPHQAEIMPLRSDRRGQHPGS